MWTETEPRFENDDYSPYAGSEYREKEPREKNCAGLGPRGYKRSDDRVFEEVCEALKSDPTVNASQITVKVDDRIVTLEGTARNRMEKRIAEMIALEISGVLDVRNEIRLS